MSTVTPPVPVAAPAAARPHSRVEDVVGLLTGTFLASFGIFLLTSSSVVTGGTAGLGLLLSYALPVPFGVVFSTVNVPFLVLAWRAKGRAFTLRTAACVAAVSAFSGLHHLAVPALSIAPLYGAVLGNLCAGVGILILFRHRASLGGFNVLALLCQERLGWRAGYVQMALDVTVVLASLTVVRPAEVLVSAVGAVVLNLVLVLNHRPGRYQG